MDVSVDCVLFGFDGESLKLLLIRQRTESAGELTEAALQMALPGNLVKEDESLDAAAKRVLSELTQLDDVFLKQFHAFGHPDRVSDLKDQQWLEPSGGTEEPRHDRGLLRPGVLARPHPFASFLCRRRALDRRARLAKPGVRPRRDRLSGPGHTSCGIGIQAHFV